MSALDVQVGGSHYKGFEVQPCVFIMGLSGPAAHIVPYLVRTKGEDDLDKATHWCDLAIEHGMQGVVPVLVHADTLSSGATEAIVNDMGAMEWCWKNNIPSGSYLAHALMAAEEGDYAEVKRCVHAMKEFKS